MTVNIGGSQRSLENSHTCPYLGLADDGQTALAFSSDWNCCHHCKPVTAVKLDHQRMYCLSPDHRNCTAYAQPPDNAMPRELRGRHPARGGSSTWTWLTLALAFFALMIILGLYFSTQIRTFLPPEILEIVVRPSVPPTALPVYVTPSSDVSPTLTPSALPPSATSTPIPTLVLDDPVLATIASADPTATITRIPRDIETLIGINYIFRIHRVRHGENLETLAYLNGTTIAAIFAVNYKFSAPLWVDQVIIIPINQTDVSDLPPFESYRVTEDISLDDLAVELNADSGQIQFYNGLGTSTQLHHGEWIIVPREKE